MVKQENSEIIRIFHFIARINRYALEKTSIVYFKVTVLTLEVALGPEVAD